MDKKQERYDIDFANQKSISERERELLKLRQMAYLLTSYEEFKQNGDSEEIPQTESIGKQRVRSTTSGRAMSEQRPNGYSSALMLGIISFVFEILFVFLAIFLYK